MGKIIRQTRKVTWFSDLLWLGVDSCGVVSACVKHDDGVLGDFGDVLAGAGEVEPAGRLVIIPGEKIRITRIMKYKGMKNKGQYSKRGKK